MTSIQWSDGAPIYRQLKDRVIAMMLDGILKPGDALPSVRAMYDELKGKGLEVVGVTRYYGYYGTEKGLTPEQEYERMKQFIVDQKINWPIAFTDAAAFKDYAVSGIPHVVVIDRAGKVHKIKVGYNKAGEEAFHKEIEKLLAS